jgi:hypothetical protein
MRLRMLPEPPPAMQERAAADQLYPTPRVVQAAPVDVPLNGPRFGDRWQELADLARKLEDV